MYCCFCLHWDTHSVTPVSCLCERVHNQNRTWAADTDGEGGFKFHKCLILTQIFTLKKQHVTCDCHRHREEKTLSPRSLFRTFILFLGCNALCDCAQLRSEFYEYDQVVTKLNAMTDNVPRWLISRDSVPGVAGLRWLSLVWDVSVGDSSHRLRLWPWGRCERFRVWDTLLMLPVSTDQNSQARN